MSWLDQLKSEPGDPPDGNHTATLVRAVIKEAESGWHGLILEWQTLDFAFYWTSFHGVGGQQTTFTRQTLDRLGVDVENAATESEVADMLAALEGAAYVVNVKRSGQYLNTNVIERPERVQTTMPTVAPTPAATPSPANAIFGDDDVPF